MIVRWPGTIKPGQVSDFPWAFWDFLPTAAEIAGVKDKIPAGIDGQSVLPTLLGKQQKPHEFFYWEFHEKGSKQAVRMGDWKAVRLARFFHLTAGKTTTSLRTLTTRHHNHRAPITLG